MTTAHPVFVPVGDHHLAAVLTLPDGEPRGLVMLITGIGAHRSHRYQLWTRAAKELAADGIASIRYDHHGLGDSTEERQAWSMMEVPVDRARAVAELGMQAAGTRDLVLVGNCYGAWAALLLGAELPNTKGVAFIRAPILLSQTGIRGLVMRAKRFARRVRKRDSKGHGAPVRLRGIKVPNLGSPPNLLAALRRVIGHGRMAFVFGQGEPTFNARTQRVLREMTDGLPAHQRERLELRVVPGRTLTGFESMQTQEALIGAVVAFARDVLLGSGSVERSEPDADAPTRKGVAVS